MDIEITRMSAKGQIVIPKEMRKDIKEGEKLLIIKSGKHIILERTKDLKENFEEDIEFARRTEEGWKDVDKGRYSEYAPADYIKKLKR